MKKIIVRMAVAALLFLAAVLLPVSGMWRVALFLIPYLLLGWDVLREAGESVWKRELLDENFLMAVASIGAFVLGEYAEAVAVMLLFRIGELFEDSAVDKSRRNIAALMVIRPDSANVEDENGQLRQVAPETVAVGTVIVVQPGEKIPIDGIVETGESTLDTAALTGESVPRNARTGDPVCSGCVNLSGVLRIRTTKEFGESTASKILDLVENASSRKSKSENFISKFATVYTPTVCVGALALAILPPLGNLLAGSAPGWGTWIYRALSFLVISCPCALVISIPLTFFAGLGGASRAGVLIKGSNYLETLSRVRTVVFDKTGTMTEGVFAVTEVSPVGVTERELLYLAAAAERFSGHPISRSLQNACDASEAVVSDVQERSGQGVLASVDGKRIAVGNEKLLRSQTVSFTPCDKAGTVVYAAADGVFIGWILISDRMKKTAKTAVEKLRKAGVRKTVMLTGDSRAAGEAAATELRVDQVFTELLPADKVEKVETLLQKQSSRETLAFVGDGINDAPVLARADVGVAMGALGSDAAIEAADVVLMDDDPEKIAKAIAIAKKCTRIAYENIAFAIGVKLACLVLGALGVTGMWTAIFADVGVMVIAVLNAVRALRVRKL